MQVTLLPQLPESNQRGNEFSQQMTCCVRDIKRAKQNLERLKTRTQGNAQETAKKTVEEILENVRLHGDEALIEYTQKFDGFTPSPLNISSEALEKAWAQTSTNIKDALLLAHKRIKDFHEQQIPKDLKVEGLNGEKLGRHWRPVETAGLYIPGGRASYPSSVLMNAIPAKVAGVKHLFMVSPANEKGEINPTVLAAAHLCEIDNVFRIGGAQAIAALAYGTKSVRKVDVITGPGNLFVTLAKKAVFGQVGIDSLAGPSEVLIIADQSSRIEQVAADLLAQAEHDPLAAAVLLTTDPNLANNLPIEINKQLKNHPRAEICKASLNDWGIIAICETLDECIELSNFFAPEHLELLIEKPSSIIDQIENAGAIFIGPWTPEAVGDYLAGPNHTLPTSGTARFSGALCVETFMKATSTIEFTKKALESTSQAVKELAKSEGLHSHAESVRLRI